MHPQIQDTTVTDENDEIYKKSSTLERKISPTPYGNYDIANSHYEFKFFSGNLHPIGLYPLLPTFCFPLIFEI